MSFACYLNLWLTAFVLAYEAEPTVTWHKLLLLLGFRSTATVWINSSLRGRPRCCDAMTVAGGAGWRFGIQCPLVMCHIKLEKLSFDIIAILKTYVPTPASVSIFTPKREYLCISEKLVSCYGWEIWSVAVMKENRIRVQNLRCPCWYQDYGRLECNIVSEEHTPGMKVARNSEKILPNWQSRR